MDKNVATWKDSILQSHNTLQKQKTKKIPTYFNHYPSNGTNGNSDFYS